MALSIRIHYFLQIRNMYFLAHFGDCSTAELNETFIKPTVTKNDVPVFYVCSLDFDTYSILFSISVARYGVTNERTENNVIFIYLFLFIHCCSLSVFSFQPILSKQTLNMEHAIFISCIVYNVYMWNVNLYNWILVFLFMFCFRYFHVLKHPQLPVGFDDSLRNSGFSFAMCITYIV